jgi:hypothetical protein
MRNLTNHLIENGRLIEGKEFGLTVVYGGDPASELARSVEYMVFFDTFGNDYTTMEKEYTPYDSSSVFILVVDMRTKLPVGTLRLIVDNPYGLKTVKDVASNDFSWKQDMIKAVNHYLKTKPHALDAYKEVSSKERLVDVGTIAVLRAYRSGHNARLLSLALIRAAVAFTINNNYRDWITIIDLKVLRAMQAVFANPLEAEMPGLEALPYLGSQLSVPAYVNIEELITSAKNKIGIEQKSRKNKEIIDSIDERISILQDLILINY